jgi:deazaflavin-dependent oxidoreductase (nitroreductase family)
MTSLLRRAGRARAWAHRRVFTATRGRVLRRWVGKPALRLTTTGRVTGRPVHTMLVVVLRDGERLVVAASDGGADRHPQWYLNLCREPRVEVLMNGRRRAMTARTATAAERAELWPRVRAGAPAYGRYQDRTAREIPLVLLEPAGRASGS